MKEKRICDDLTVRATLPAYSNFNDIVVKNCPNKPKTPPSRSMKISDPALGSTLPSLIIAIINDDTKPTIAKHVIGVVACRSENAH